MRVNVGVCGIFHYRKYVGELSRRGVLGAFYYSHRRSTDAAALDIVAGDAVNLYLKEYLLRGGERALPFMPTDWLRTLAHGLWERQMLRRWRTCDVFHLMLHGTAPRALRHARAAGAITLGEPVMSHPATLQRLVEQEHELLGLPKPSRPDISTSRLLDETSNCDHLLAGSEFIRRSFVGEGFPAERTHVIPYAVDVGSFYPLTDAERARVDDGKFRVICVAQVVPRKGQHYLLDAWKRLRLSPTEAELVLVGQVSPDMKGVLAKYDGLFTHKPHVPHESLRMEYGRSSVFVLPSVEDGFGYVTAEAMGCGLPVITTHNAGSADVVEDGGNGFVVAPRSPEAIAERLEQLYRDTERRRAMGARSLEMSRNLHGWKHYVDRLVDLYAQITNASTPKNTSPALATQVH
jgi:glycosyltransferase involved in cell wall biosynthesis